MSRIDRKRAERIACTSSVVVIDGRQAYWYSPKSRIAWSSVTEWTLTDEQIAGLVADCPLCNADERAKPAPLGGDFARRHNDLYNESGDGYIP